MAPRLVPVKLRPDVYCCKIVDITRVGRKVVKVTRLRKEDMIKYEKVKERPPPSPEVEEAEFVSSSSVTLEVDFEATMIEDNVNKKTGNNFVEEVSNEAMDINRNNVVVNGVRDEQEGRFPSEYEETVSSNSSLALVLTDSEDDDDDYDDAHENDIACNLVEDVQPKHLVPRRVVLSKGGPRREKIKFGFSKFEFKNSTQNLDRFFAPKPRLKIRFKRQRLSNQTNRKDPAVEGSINLIEAKPNVVCDEPSDEVLIDSEDLTFDKKQEEELSVQNDSVQFLTDDHPHAEFEFGKVDTNVDDVFVEVNFDKELNKVFTSGNLVIDEEQDELDESNKESTTKLDETEFRTLAEFIEDPLDDKFDKNVDEDGTVSENESVQALDTEGSIEKSVAKASDDVQTVLEMDCEYPDIDEDNQTSEKFSDEAALEIFHKNYEDFNTLEPIVENDLKEDHSSIPFYKNILKPDDEQVMPPPPTAEDLLPSTEVCEAGIVQDCTKVLTEIVLSTEFTLDTKEEVDKPLPCLAVWTLTARQAREESSLASCHDISQVQPTISQCGETVLNLPAPKPEFGAECSIIPCALESGSKSSPVKETAEFKLNHFYLIQDTTAPRPLFGAALESSSKDSPEELKVNLNPSYPIPDTPAETDISTPPQDNISELLTPSSVQLQSYLSDAIVSDLDLQVLASLDTSPDVIITEVPHVARDSENNVIDVKRFENASTSDDSDSDVVLLSDDETELCSPTPSLTIISSWQLDILSQTWQAWPVPTQAILLHLGLETGLSDGTLRDWFKKRTDQELVRVWGELENM